MNGLRVFVLHDRGEDRLARCLGSLPAAPPFPIDLVVVANGPERPRLSTGLPRPPAEIIHTPRSLGFGAANNYAVARAAKERGPAEHYLFLNDDTVVAPGALERLAAALTASPGAAIAGPRLMLLGRGGTLNSLGLHLTVYGDAWDEGIGRPWAGGRGPSPPRPVLAVTGAALWIRACVLHELGGWAELFDFYYEDLDLALRVRANGWEVLLVPDAVVHHELSATSGQGSPGKHQLMLRNRFLLVLSHWPGPLLLRTLPLLVGREIARCARRVLEGERGLARIQTRAWAGALGRLPDVLRHRRRVRPRGGWTEWLRDPDSAPRIELPPPLPPPSGSAASSYPP